MRRSLREAQQAKSNDPNLWPPQPQPPTQSFVPIEVVQESAKPSTVYTVLGVLGVLAILFLSALLLLAFNMMGAINNQQLAVYYVLLAAGTALYFAFRAYLRDRKNQPKYAPSTQYDPTKRCCPYCRTELRGTPQGQTVTCPSCNAQVVMHSGFTLSIFMIVTIGSALAGLFLMMRGCALLQLVDH